ncbi:SDR family oxidoreductase [Actinomadura rayongensis]|uniref:SDR family oxidoreductase n=1 Tax=Actinomadura rayongensis TaxID=1429076 RepID=A0A6I4WJF9_9ACTN|nr:SDR family oxidoreductase [Actinomadura rayongensis]MXQ66732.1 SDR family oxidoreductase [Actinomadura rayongensis]
MGILTGKAAVVTGGSRGIGRAIVERLAFDGAEVVFSYAHSSSGADDVVRTVASGGGVAHAVRADLTERGAASRLMETASDRLGGLDVLVNNAVPSFTMTPLAETGEDVFDAVLTAGAKAVFLTLRYAARHMRDDGRVVNISTINTVLPTPGVAPYVAAKGAVEQLTLAAAQELGPRGITVNTVSPGATDTDLFRSVTSPETAEQVAGRTPLRRIGTPPDVAAVVAFLAGPDARWITGQNVRASGGLG